MKFIPAKQLRAKFSCFGHFYEVWAAGVTYRCRSVLEICELGRDHEQSVPDAIIVMMNPGSSSPADSPSLAVATLSSIPSMKATLVKAKPDTTQYQIMRLMLLQKWKHVRIINLPDLCGGDSSEFFKEHKILAKQSNAELLSLFGKGRRRERIRALKVKADGRVIVAWGVDRRLKPLIKQFREACSKVTAVGLPHKINEDGYLHPSPSPKVDKIKWLKATKRVLSAR